MKARQLRTRIIAYFVGVAVFISLLFGFVCFLFAYTIEDHLFNFLLKDEATYITEQLEAGNPPIPRLGFIKYLESEGELPDFIKHALSQEPRAKEFAGADDKHYHMVRMEKGVLLAEVSEHLVVRKIKVGMLNFLLVALAVVLVVAVILAYLSLAMAKKLLKPLDKLVDIVAEAPVEKLPQNFSKQFVNDEIGEFAQTLERALDRIRQFIDREQAFTRDASHELRTPIAVTQGALTLLNQSELNDKQQQLILRAMSAQAQMAQSVETLLALAREETITQKEVKLLPIVENCVLQQAEKIADKNIEIAIEVPSSATMAIGESALNLLLSNLIGNAFAHIVSGQVCVRYDNGVLSVEDTGPGIPQEIRSQLFSSGVKGEGSEGLGMGLSIVHRLCQRLNISLDYHSNESGTRFIITCPSHN
ncbi:two-component sensor histidine kinase [Pseudoalteromonas luteoviolacea]|uniref:Signal transduction histidine-protein kinase/phosphatase MprB n=1 Tax=Pseudoalteromonas luteoviolacea TaxID=43657 RepID=A0A1C0TR20_9GAMM|nr:HAMP domain-containing sensor histidine kinase [Pseudoalteromonas luteoviolacea]OCQ21384.1 two-component sensor histidine kinase [Pseudoalteromonas luteoviolacea]